MGRRGLIDVLSDEVKIEYQDEELTVPNGRSLFAALWDRGIVSFHRTTKGAPRGGFCGIGMCFDCVAVVDDVPNVRTCMTPAQDGMTVFPQQDPGQVP